MYKYCLLSEVVTTSIVAIVVKDSAMGKVGDQMKEVLFRGRSKSVCTSFRRFTHWEARAAYYQAMDA